MVGWRKHLEDSLKAAEALLQSVSKITLHEEIIRLCTAYKPFSGRLMLRISLELHSTIAMAARRNHKSINAWIAETCSNHAV